MPKPGSNELNYSEVGFTEAGMQLGERAKPGLPAGYRYLWVTRRLPGTNFDAVARALLNWGVHAAAGVKIQSESDRAAPGVEVVTCVGVGRAVIKVPCRVLWVVDTADRAEFGYGSLNGHWFSGEEAFGVERRSNGEIWFSVLAYSRPVKWFLRAAGPLAPIFQRLYLLWLARAAGRISGQPVR